MTTYVKEPHTPIFSGPTSCGKTQQMLDLIELDRSWIFRDDYVFLVVPNGNLFQVIEKLSTMLSGEETLFIVDDVIADETLDKKRQSLLDLAISGRHRKHSLWL